MNVAQGLRTNVVQLGTPKHTGMAKNGNEASPLTPIWVRVRMNVALRLPTW